MTMASEVLRITNYDRELARRALAQLAANRLEVTLVPCDTGAGKKRVAISENPEFYRRFLDHRRRPRQWRDRRRAAHRKKPRVSGWRRNVQRALERIRDDQPWNRSNWIGWELLDILYELEGGR